MIAGKRRTGASMRIALVAAGLLLGALSLTLAASGGASASTAGTANIILHAPGNTVVDAYIQQDEQGITHDRDTLDVLPDQLATMTRRWSGIRFDLSMLPVGAQVTSAMLTLTV